MPLVDNIDAVLFDLDGTLVETNIDFPLMKRNMIELARNAGMDPSSLAEMDILAIVEAASQFLFNKGKQQEAADLHDQAMRVLEEIELRHAATTQEIPFARELLTELRQRKIGIGIVTRNCRSASIMSLKMTRLNPDVLVCREDSYPHKPHPAPLLKALKTLNAQPERSIMVGDHLMDIESGKAAGMKTIGFLRPLRSNNFFDEVHPDLVVTSLEEVKDAVIGSNS